MMISTPSCMSLRYFWCVAWAPAAARLTQYLSQREGWPCLWRNRLRSLLILELNTFQLIWHLNLSLSLFRTFWAANFFGWQIYLDCIFNHEKPVIILSGHMSCIWRVIDLKSVKRGLYVTDRNIYFLANNARNQLSRFGRSNHIDLSRRHILLPQRQNINVYKRQRGKVQQHKQRLRVGSTSDFETPSNLHYTPQTSICFVERVFRITCAISRSAAAGGNLTLQWPGTHLCYTDAKNWGQETTLPNTYGNSFLVWNRHARYSSQLKSDFLNLLLLFFILKPWIENDWALRL